MSEMDNSWLIFKLAKRDFAFQTKDIIEMISLGSINKIPDAPHYIRGVMNLRNRIIPLIDLRKKLQMESLLEENEKLCELLIQRKQDHINWLNELYLSVIENREFKLTTDPHKCAFGKWYDNFKSENVYIKILLDKFDEPHKKIHAIAQKVSEIIRIGKRDEAIAQIEFAKQGILQKMISLFDQTVTTLRENCLEIVIVITHNELLYGFAVDAVTDVVDIVKDNIELPPSLQQTYVNQYIHGIGKVDDKLNVLLDLPRLLSDCSLTETVENKTMLQTN